MFTFEFPIPSLNHVRIFFFVKNLKRLPGFPAAIGVLTRCRFYLYFQAMRVDILRILFERKEIMVKDRDQVLARIAQQMDGYVAADIDNLVMQAAHAATSESGTMRNSFDPCSFLDSDSHRVSTSLF